MRLTVDVGTNAEIVLGDKHRLLAASSPTGPAFEGAQISGGQRAAPGAIERVRIDRETLEPRFRVIGSPRWSDEPGFESVVRRLGVTGICGSGIVEVIAEMFLAGIVTTDGIVDGSLAARSPRIVPDGRTFSYVLHEGRGPGLAAHRRHPERRAGDPAREGRPVRRRAAAHGPPRHRRGRRDPARGRVRQPDRPAPRDGPRPRPRLRPRPCRPGRQCGRDRRAHRAAVGGRPARDRDGRPPGREDRDRGRAALPAALRRGDGLPPQDGADAASRASRSSCRPGARSPVARRPRSRARAANDAGDASSPSRPRRTADGIAPRPARRRPSRPGRAPGEPARDRSSGCRT